MSDDKPSPTVEQAGAVPVATDDDVERLARACGWDNRKYMTPADYGIWCSRMRQFVRLAGGDARAQALRDAAEKCNSYRNEPGRRLTEINTAEELSERILAMVPKS